MVGELSAWGELWEPSSARGQADHGAVIAQSDVSGLSKLGTSDTPSGTCGFLASVRPSYQSEL